MDIAQLQKDFQAAYGRDPLTFRAPGRVNLIGEHTDYNEGFVMPAAIDFHTYVAVAPRGDRKLRVFSENFNETRMLDLDQILPGRTGHWSDYVRGVAAVLQSRECHLAGADIA